LLLQVNAWAVKGRDDDIRTEATCTCVYMRLCESFVTIVIIRILDDKKLPFLQGCFMHGTAIGGVELAFSRGPKMTIMLPGWLQLVLQEIVLIRITFFY
jgi:hypothetical protein